FAGASSEKDADRVHAARLENVGRRHAEPAPQGAALRCRAGNDVLGLARHGDDTLPVARIDNLRGGLVDSAPQRAWHQNAKGQKPPARHASHCLGGYVSAEAHDWISETRAEPSECS